MPPILAIAMATAPEQLTAIPFSAIKPRVLRELSLSDYIECYQMPVGIVKL